MNSKTLAAVRALFLAGAMLPPAWGWCAEGAAAPVESAPSGRLSARLAALLAASLPRYVPSPTAPVNPPEARASTPSDDSVLHLPKYVVHGPRPPVMQEREVLTPRGRSELAQHRYISELDQALNRYRIPLFGVPPAARALAMYEEDERLRKMDDLDRIVRAVALVDRASAADLRHVTAATFQRSTGE